MANYSVTLNFFLPEKFVKALKEVKLHPDPIFDWRVPGLCHCTVKAITSLHEFPSDQDLSDWIERINVVLEKKVSFKVSIRGVSRFPGFPYAILESEALITLHNELFNVLPSSQPHFEGRDYIPHASLGIMDDAFADFEDQRIEFGAFDVNELQLVVWDIDRLKEPKIFQRFLMS